MDSDRPYFRNTSTGSCSATATTTSELFICFTSRLSSTSSMKISKSILSPGRTARDGGPVSLSSSLSRRLRTNGSLKGGQASPFFNTSGKKRGCTFDNPEPSSPKVTCIGQVRVKTKKKVKQSRSLSKRRSGEVSFRKIDQQSGADADDKAQQQRYSNTGAHFQAPPPQECLPHRNQRWVHLPISICEALRTFGAEFSCLFPCRSSCSSTSESVRDECEKQNGNDNGCGAVFSRWLVSVNDGEGGKRREIELVVGGGDEEEEEEERVSMRTSRRHVFDDIEIKGDRIELKGQSLEREEEAARVSVCIPPKNALLLMRCRSDPMKMAALANNRPNFDADAAIATATSTSERNEKEDIEEEEEEEEGGEEESMVDCKDEAFEKETVVSKANDDEKEITNEVEDKLEIEGEKEEREEEELGNSSEDMVEKKTELGIIVLEEPNEELVVEESGGGGCNGDGDGDGNEEEEEVESNMSSFEALLDQENAEHYEDCCPIQDEEEAEEDAPVCHLSPAEESDEKALHSYEPPTLHDESSAAAAAAALDEAAEDSNIEQKSSVLEKNEERIEGTAPPPATTDDVDAQVEQKLETEAKLEKTQGLVTNNENQGKKEKEGPLLPDCLLLMMCEPKLSMEVSKETWVCSTDFMRWMPELPRKAAKAAKPGDHEKRRLSVDSKPKQKNEFQQPPRSSCSFPAAAAAASMASLIEQKLVNAVAYEPFVLTRCKSEPMRTAAAKLMPESCFWNKSGVRKLGVGVGAAGVGF